MNNKSKTKNPALIAMFALTLLVPGAALQSAYASDSTVDVDILVNEMSTTQNEISQLESDPVKNAEKIDALTDKFWAYNDLINTVTDVVPERNFLSEWEALEIRKQGLYDQLDGMNDLGASGDISKMINDQIIQIDIEIEQLRQESIKSMVLDTKTQNELKSIQDMIHREYPHIIDTAIDAEEKKVSVLVDYDISN